VGGSQGQFLQLWTKVSGQLDYQDILPVSFVPLRGKFGWGQGEWSTLDEGDPDD
jgi:hypothetical protein